MLKETIVWSLIFVLYLLMSTPSIASPPLFCRAKLYNLLFISRFRMQPSNVPVVSRKCAVFEKCPSGDPSTTGKANVILEKSPYKENEIQNKLSSKLFGFFEFSIFYSIPKNMYAMFSNILLFSFHICIAQNLLLWSFSFENISKMDLVVKMMKLEGT